ncbi:MAG: DUF2935 domain-containing protein [Alphaproteobacteria bacterium]|nr:DUF2935 domain-containing protein [Alphaproteobacteria bacterium]
MISKTIRHAHKNLKIYTRGDKKDLGPYEKIVILPALDNNDAALHAWSDARFAIDIMAEHALFFALLMPREIAKKEHIEALQFHKTFTKLLNKIDKTLPPKQEDLRSFTKEIIDNIKPFIEYKERSHEGQIKGTLRCLVWPLFFHHTQHEAERWNRRLDKLGKGKCEFDSKEVTTLWVDIVDEHARLLAHLLDPDERDLIEKALKTSEIFTAFKKGNTSDIISASVHDPKTLTRDITKIPETDLILSAAETVLDFETKNVRDVEAARIKSIIDPRFADHNRRETLKFIDELKRVV